MTLFDSIAQSIATFEGFYQAGSVAQRNKNPGNLRVGAPADSRGYTIFPDAGAGWTALVADIAAKFRKYPNYTFLGFFERYAPSSDSNDPFNYASYVVSRANSELGTAYTLDTTLADAAAGNIATSGGTGSGDIAVPGDGIQPGEIDLSAIDWNPPPPAVIAIGAGLVVLAIATNTRRR